MSKIFLPPSLRAIGRAELVVAFIGAGNAFTRHDGRGETNFVLAHSGHIGAVDCGRRWLDDLAPTTLLGTSDVDSLFVTHCDPDHCGGVGSFAQKSRWLEKRKPELVLPEALDRCLWDETLKGALAPAGMKPSTLEDYFRVLRPRPIDERRALAMVGDLEMEIFRTRHNPGDAPSWREAAPSFGVYLPKFQVFFSGDSCFDPELVLSYAARGASHFFLDTSRNPSAVHASLAENLTLPAEIRERAWLVHLADDFRDEEAEGFAGTVSPGECFRVTFDQSRAD
jgi:glyoxylase-like metal-dependent hydrolase (beta-lactamase superfamily II)